MSGTESQLGRPAIVLKKSVIAENIQNYREKLDWHAAIAEMEKLFTIDRDPHIRVRIGDVQRKINGHGAAIKEYVFAADLFAERGFIAKALAQYSLALRLDSSNEYVRSKVKNMRGHVLIRKYRHEMTEYHLP